MKGKWLAVLVSNLMFVSILGAWAGNSASNVPIAELPTVRASNVSSLSNPSSAPDDLTLLTPKISKSVVTIICANGQGTGWAINAEFTAQQKSQGFTSYLVTNHHVIAKCTQNTSVTLILADMSREQGFVYTWDEKNDLAGILTTVEIPSLNWQGSTPVQGYWVGVIGSPLGFAGILTTGIVSGVDNATMTGTFTAPATYGSSGGPVFDRSGRVIGVVKGGYIDSAGFNVFKGAPLLCETIINCPGGSNIWYGQTRATAIFKTNPYLLNQDAVQFLELNGDTNKGILTCYTSPALTDEMIDSGNIIGTYWRITDITTATVIDSYLMPIQKKSSDLQVSELTSNGVKQSTLLKDLRLYIYVFSNQVKDHKYECAVSIVAKDTVGEFTTKEKIARIQGYNFNAVEEEETTPTPSPANEAKKTQLINNWNLKSEISLGVQRASFVINATSGLPVTVISEKQEFCLASGKEVIPIKVGRCVLKASQPGNSEYLPADNRVLVIDIVAARKATISCFKGKLIKKVTGFKPVCPFGYKKK